MVKTIKRTHEEYLELMSNLHPSITVIGTYKNTNTKVELFCNVCENEWKTTPYCSINLGYGCPECAKVLRGKEKSLKHSLKFKEKLLSEFPHIEMIGEYDKAKTLTKFKCNIHNEVFESTPDYVSTSKFGCCPKCNSDDKSKRFSLGDEVIRKRFNSIHPNIEIISEIKGTNYYSELKCKICSHQWKSKLSNNLGTGKHGCPKCSGTLKKTAEKFKEEMKAIHGNDVIVIGEYKSNHKNVKLKCSKCNCEWDSTPKNSLRGNGCPNCYGWKSEKKLMSLIAEYHPNLKTQKRFDDLVGVGGNKLSYDGYLEIDDRMILIERQGHAHDRPIKYFGGEERFKIQQEHDRRKREYAKNNGYELIEIWYYDEPLEILQKHGLCLEDATLL